MSVSSKFYMRCLSEDSLTLHKVGETRVKLRKHNYFTLGGHASFVIHELGYLINNNVFNPRPTALCLYSEIPQIRILEQREEGSDITIMGGGEEREYVFGVSGWLIMIINYQGRWAHLISISA